jgi:hypothetical protein
MSYQLGCMEDNTEVKKAVNKVQEYYDVQDRRGSSGQGRH